MYQVAAELYGIVPDLDVTGGGGLLITTRTHNPSCTYKHVIFQDNYIIPLRTTALYCAYWSLDLFS